MRQNGPFAIGLHKFEKKLCITGNCCIMQCCNAVLLCNADATLECSATADMNKMSAVHTRQTTARLAHIINYLVTVFDALSLVQACKVLVSSASRTTITSYVPDNCQQNRGRFHRTSRDNIGFRPVSVMTAPASISSRYGSDNHFTAETDRSVICPITHASATCSHCSM